MIKKRNPPIFYTFVVLKQENQFKMKVWKNELFNWPEWMTNRSIVLLP